MATTTEPPRRPSRTVSVRVRITATVALLVLAGLVVAGVVVATIESRRVDQQIADEVDQEFAEFTKLQKDGIDPSTEQPFASPEAMVRLFLQRNVPDENELLIGWWDDGVGAQSPRWNDISRSAWLPDAVRPLLDDNGTTTVDSEFGELQIATQSVRQDGETGALVVVTFLDRSRTGLHETMRTYAIVATLALLLVTAMAAWVSGRLLSPLRTLRETADEISETDLAQRLPVTGNDDLTALTRTFNGMLDRLEAAFVGQRQFLDDAGHELKTPLTVLRGHLELLDTGNPEDVAETRLLLLDEIDRMSRLVGDLILLAKSDRPDFLQTQPVDLGGLTADLVAKARGLGDRTWVLDGAADIKLVADQQRLTQAVLQLADNAVKHTRDGDTVAIGSSATPTEALIWVRDTGPGVPPEDRELIFERFGRSAVPPGDEGFGLGLSIVGAVAGAHGGTVYVEDADPARRPVRDRPAEDEEAGGRVARILIVEDEQRIASFVAKGLRADGHLTATVGDGHEGLEHALSGDYDLVVLDIGLPGLDGFEVLERLRAQGSQVPVVVLTARDSVGDTVSALEGGADDYMPKPFRFAELLARVRLRLRQPADEVRARDDALECGGIRLDLRSRRADVGERQVELSAREFALAEMFMTNAGQVLSREQLLDHVWGLDFDPGSNVVDVYVGYLRKKFGAQTIATVRGMGYRFNR